MSLSPILVSLRLTPGPPSRARLASFRPDQKPKASSKLLALGSWKVSFGGGFSFSFSFFVSLSLRTAGVVPSGRGAVSKWVGVGVAGTVPVVGSVAEGAWRGVGRKVKLRTVGFAC